MAKMKEKRAEEIVNAIHDDQFKLAVLEKYKDAIDQELAQVEMHKKNVDKAVDFCYEDICFAIRRSLKWEDEEKERLVSEGKIMTGAVKATVYQILADKEIKVIG